MFLKKKVKWDQVFFFNISIKKCFYKYLKNYFNSVFDNILYKYKNNFNNDKILKMIFVKKIKYYNKSKTFITKYIYIYINIYIIKKKFKKIHFYEREVKRKRRVRRKWGWRVKGKWWIAEKCILGIYEKFEGVFFFRETPP